jgi:hypothetical protein
MFNWDRVNNMNYSKVNTTSIINFSISCRLDRNSSSFQSETEGHFRVDLPIDLAKKKLQGFLQGFEDNRY